MENRQRELKAMGNKRIFRRQDVIKHKIKLSPNVWYVYADRLIDLKTGYLSNAIPMKKGNKLIESETKAYYYPVWEDLV